MIELRQNETIDLSNIPDAGTYTWYVYPLDQNFLQIACHEGGPWTFTKAQMPTPTPTSAALGSGGTRQLSKPRIIGVIAVDHPIVYSRAQTPHPTAGDPRTVSLPESERNTRQRDSARTVQTIAASQSE